MAYFLLLMFFLASYLFFETLNLIVGNNEKIGFKRFMFILTSVCISVALFYLIIEAS